MKLPGMISVSEDVLLATASIIGPHSAAAKALEDASRRRNAGETVEFFKCGASIFVRGSVANKGNNHG